MVIKASHSALKTGRSAFGKKGLYPSKMFQRWAWHRYLFLLGVPFFLWLALRNISIPDVWKALSGLGSFPIAILVMINILMALAMTSRWWLILQALGYHIGYGFLVGYRTAANAVSYFTPGPQFGGEPLQVYLLHRVHRVPADASTLSVAMEKLMELAANFTFLLIGILCVIRLNVHQGFLGGKTLLIPIALLAAPVGILWAVWAGKKPFSRLFLMMEKRYSLKGKEETSRFLKFIKTIRFSEDRAEAIFRERPAILFQATLFSVLHWACILGEFWLIFHFLGATLTAIQVIVIVTAARLAFLTPLPGGAGALEASQVLIVTSFGFNPALGLGACLIMRARDLIFGSIGLWLSSIFVASAGKSRH